MEGLMLIGLYLVIALSCKPITTLPNTETHLTPFIQSGRPKLDWIMAGAQLSLAAVYACRLVSEQVIDL